MDQQVLFDAGLRDESPAPGLVPVPRVGTKRQRHAVRNQVAFRDGALDELLPEDHQARIV